MVAAFSVSQENFTKNGRGLKMTSSKTEYNLNYLGGLLTLNIFNFKYLSQRDQNFFVVFINLLFETVKNKQF